MISLDGESIPVHINGTWVDEDIQTVPLPDLAPGAHFIEVTLPLDTRVEGGGCPLRIHVPHFNAPLLAADLNGERLGTLAFPPYKLELGCLPEGTHKLDLTVFGNRMNGFGQVHHANPANYKWWGPGSFRTTGAKWSDEYILRPHGILSAPILEADQ